MTVKMVDWMPEARAIAAQCWCDPENNGKEMDPDLCESVARRIAAWMQTAAQYSGNAEYWRSQVAIRVAEERERIGQQWDGCMYDTPGEEIDIGRAIRGEK